MRQKSIVIFVGAILFGIIATFALITSLAAAQPAPLDQPETRSVSLSESPAGVLLAPTLVSVTFPGGDWPWYAQGEISIYPEPPIPAHPAEICAVVVNHHPTEPRQAALQFGVAPLGIGVPYDPIGLVELIIPPGGEARGCTHWIPPRPGKWGLEVLILQAGMVEPERSLHNFDVDEPLRPLEPHALVFPVANPLDHPATISLGLTPHLAGVGLELSQDILPDMQPGEVREVILTVTMPEIIPPDGQPIVDVEGYISGELIGGFRKVFRYPVPLHRSPDPSFAESEISVHPYPLRLGEPTELCVDLFNMTALTQTVQVQFAWADFGIGLPFQPLYEPRTVTLPPYSLPRECIYWVPPMDGQVGLQVNLFLEGYPPQSSRRIMDVDEPLLPDLPHSRSFPVQNPFLEPVTITLGLIPHLPDWGLELSQDVIPALEPGATQVVTLTVTRPGYTPEDGAPIVDVEAYVKGERIGGFRKLFSPPVRLHVFPDPRYAEREISIHPYPLLAGEPAEVCVDLYNPTSETQQVTLYYSWAQFGIGLPFQPINGPRNVELPPHSRVRECLHWVPPVSGQVCLQVELDMEAYQPQFSRLNLDVNEPLQPGEAHARTFPVGNPFDHPVTIELGVIPHLPGWGISLSQAALPDIQPGEIRLVTLTVTPTLDMPPDEHPVVDIEAYADGRLVGGFRKIFRPEVPIHRPKDPIYAESEIYIQPYPTRALEPTLVGVEIRNPTPEPQVVGVTFSAAGFGIGLPFTPIHPQLVVEVPALGSLRPEIIWIPPQGGLWCIQVDLELPGLDTHFYSQRNIDLGEPFEPGIAHTRMFEVGNPTNAPLTITLGLIPHLDGWGLELSQDVLPDMAPGEVRGVALTVTPAAELPADDHPVVDVEAYGNSDLIGGFRKVYRPPVPVHRPKDPVYAESEIGVDPYPVLPGEPVELSVEVYNPTEEDRVITATFSIAQFGIGLPFSSAFITPNPVAIFVPALGAARGRVTWNPPEWGGKFCVRVELALPGHEPIWSQRNIDVGEPLEPGQPHTLDFLVGSWPYQQPVTVTLGTVKYKDGWEVKLSQTSLTNVLPGQPVQVSLTVTPTLDAELGSGSPILDVEGFVDGELLGGFRKLDIPPIPLHKPHEKSYAESEISIIPYPPRLSLVSTVSTVVQNNSEITQTIDLEFGWADFGMGIPFTTTGMAPSGVAVELGPLMTQTVATQWTPTQPGHQCVQIHLTDPQGIYEPQLSQRNVDVEYQPPCGQTQVFTFTVYNDSPLTVTVDVGMITFNVPADWQITLEPTPTLSIAPFDSGVVKVTVSIPCPVFAAQVEQQQDIQTLQLAGGSVPTIDVEGYVSGKLIGGIELQFVAEAPPGLVLYLPQIGR